MWFDIVVQLWRSHLDREAPMMFGRRCLRAAIDRSGERRSALRRQLERGERPQPRAREQRLAPDRPILNDGRERDTRRARGHPDRVHDDKEGGTYSSLERKATVRV